MVDLFHSVFPNHTMWHAVKLTCASSQLHFNVLSLPSLGFMHVLSDLMIRRCVLCKSTFTCAPWYDVILPVDIMLTSHWRHHQATHSASSRGGIFFIPVHFSLHLIRFRGVPLLPSLFLLVGGA